MNAIEYGSAGSPDVPVTIEVVTTDHELRVRITDRALGRTPSEPPRPASRAQADPGARGLASGRLFLINIMVDRVG